VACFVGIEVLYTLATEWCKNSNRSWKYDKNRNFDSLLRTKQAINHQDQVHTSHRKSKVATAIDPLSCYSRLNSGYDHVTPKPLGIYAPFFPVERFKLNKTSYHA